MLRERKESNHNAKNDNKVRMAQNSKKREDNFMWWRCVRRRRREEIRRLRTGRDRKRIRGDNESTRKNWDRENELNYRVNGLEQNN